MNRPHIEVHGIEINTYSFVIRLQCTILLLDLAIYHARTQKDKYQLFISRSFAHGP